MVGMVQKLLLDMVESVGGQEAVEDVKRRSGVSLDKHFNMNEVYEDDEWQRLFASTCDVLQLSREQAIEAFADYFFKDAIKRWPAWFSMSCSAREFLQRQPKIHNGFASAVDDQSAGEAINDKFKLETNEAEIIMHYRSPNRLCDLYKALASRIITHYDDEATIEEFLCMHQGDEECEIHIRWAA